MSERTTARSRSRAVRCALAGNGILVAVLCWAAATCLAQAPGAAEKSPLAAKQEIARDRVGQLEDRLFRLADSLSKSDPDQAARLKAALARSRELLVRRNMDDVIALLNKGDVADAADRQKVLLAALDEVLKLLLDDSVDLEKKQAEMRRMREVRERIKSLLGDEKQQREASRQAAQDADRLAKLRDAVEQIDSLLRRQQAAVEETADARKAPQSDGQALAIAQAGIRADTEAVSGALGKLAAQPDSQPATRPAETQPVADARENLQRAAAQMKDAESPLSEKRFDAAEAGQKRAAESLKNAMKRLADEAESLRRKIDAERLAEAQRKTAESAGKIAGDMSQTPDGERKENMPGRENVEQARKNMDDAGRDLGEKKMPEAGKQQDQAIEQLSQAMKELEEALRQMRQEQQEEVLRRLEDRFREMLSRQLGINGETARLARSPASQWSRNDQLAAGKAGQGEMELAAEADKILTILRQEGTSVAIPRVVEQLAADLRDAGARLSASDAGAETLRLQADVVQTLEQLLEAVKQMRARMANRSSSGSESQGGEKRPPPLLPDSAELKLLRAYQSRVSRDTQQFNKDRSGPAPLDADQRERIQRLAERQNHVGEMTRQLNERGRQ